MRRAAEEEEERKCRSSFLTISYNKEKRSPYKEVKLLVN
jgi:hypothetical protein